MAQQVFVDLSRKKYVASSSGGDTSQPYGEVFHQDKLHLIIQPLDIRPAGAFTSNQYEILNASGYSISILVTDTASTPATLSGPATTWTPNGTALEGTVDLHTAAMDTAFTSVNSLATYFWIQITNGTDRRVTIKTPVTIYKTAITSGTAAQYPAEEVVFRSELSQYVRFSGNPNGSTVTLPSPSGVYKVILGANDDGSGGASVEQ